MVYKLCIATIVLCLVSFVYPHVHTHGHEGIPNFPCIHNKLMKDVELEVMHEPIDHIHDERVLQTTTSGSNPAYPTGATAFTDKTVVDGWHDLRIFVDYSYAITFNNYNKGLDAKFQLSIRIIESVRNYFRAGLQVNFAASMKYSGGSCAGRRVEPFVRPIDLYIVVSPENDLSTAYFAASVPCYLSSWDKRPTLGAYILNYAFLKTNIINEYLYFSTFAHEFTHLLGFTDRLFDRFVRPDGSRIPKSEVVSTIKIGSQTFSAIILPEMIAYGKKFFGCSSFPGVPLENDGSNGSAGSHWEKLFLPQEYMNPTVENPGILSDFTFTFLEAMGWYKISIERSQRYDWGKDSGCDHFKICPKGPGYCDASQLGQTICSSEWYSKGECVKDTRFASGCLIKRSKEHSCLLREGDSQYLLPDETYGAGSRCINYRGSLGYKARCHKVTCTGTSSIIIQVGSSQVECTKKGELKNFGIDDSLECPDVAEFCDEWANKCPGDCNAHGLCLSSGSCQCYTGWTGSDCSNIEAINYTLLTSTDYYTAGRLAASVVLITIMQLLF